MNSFNLTLSGQHFIFPSIINGSLAGQSNLGCRSLPFMTLNTSFQPLLACKVSFEKSAASLMGTPLQLTLSFLFVVLKIFSLSLILVNVIMMCLGVFLLGPISLGLSEFPGLPESLFPLPDWGSFPSLFVQISFQFLGLLLLLWHPYDLDVVTLKVVPQFPHPLLILSEFFCLQSVLIECLVLPFV